MKSEDKILKYGFHSYQNSKLCLLSEAHYCCVLWCQFLFRLVKPFQRNSKKRCKIQTKNRNMVSIVTRIWNCVFHLKHIIIVDHGAKFCQNRSSHSKVIEEMVKKSPDGEEVYFFQSDHYTILHIAIIYSLGFSTLNLS